MSHDIFLSPNTGQQFDKAMSCVISILNFDTAES